jgi:hypothetical protein
MTKGRPRLKRRQAAGQRESLRRLRKARKPEPRHAYQVNRLWVLPASGQKPSQHPLCPRKVRSLQKLKRFSDRDACVHDLG